MQLRVAVFGAGLVGAWGLTWLAWQALTPTNALEAGPRTVEILAREGVVDIARALYRADVVRDPVVFTLLSVVRGSARRLRAGEYEIERGLSTFGVLKLIETGRVKQHPVLHPEGATVAELARALEAARLGRADDIVRVARDPAFLRRLDIEGPSVEGYLFPDTYQLVRGMAPDEVLARMVHRLRERLAPHILERARDRGLSVHRLLTLASIIEREAVAPDEMPLISAVFWNRLKLDMPLQADPTVQYALGKDRRALTRADLQADHPFNTYRRAGLPPGPIASPGLRAIEAALEPAPVKYLYFVAVDGRRHQFSATVEQHNAAVARYRTTRDR